MQCERSPGLDHAAWTWCWPTAATTTTSTADCFGSAASGPRSPNAASRTAPAWAPSAGPSRHHHPAAQHPPPAHPPATTRRHPRSLPRTRRLPNQPPPPPEALSGPVRPSQRPRHRPTGQNSEPTVGHRLGPRRHPGLTASRPGAAESADRGSLATRRGSRDSFGKDEHPADKAVASEWGRTSREAIESATEATLGENDPGVKGAWRECLDQLSRAHRSTSFLQDREADNGARQQELRAAGGGGRPADAPSVSLSPFEHMERVFGKAPTHLLLASFGRFGRCQEKTPSQGGGGCGPSGSWAAFGNLHPSVASVASIAGWWRVATERAATLKSLSRCSCSGAKPQVRTGQAQGERLKRPRLCI